MSSVVAGKHWYSTKSISALGKVAAGSLVAIVALLFIWSLLTGDTGPEIMVVGAIFLLIAGLIATGWRWTPVLALLPAAFAFLFLGSSLPFLFQRPNTGDFAVTTTITLLAALAGVAGVAGTIRNYLRKTTTAPGWLRYLLYGVGALILVVLVLAALPDAKSGVGVAGATEITVAEFAFPREEIRVQTGQEVVLRFENEDAAVHSFDVDALNIHETLPGGTSTLVRFTPSEPGTYTFYCAIPGHANLATGEGMVSTLVVE